MIEYIDRFWLRAIKISTEGAQRRFLESFPAYVSAVIDEASDRTGGRVRGLKDHVNVRKSTAAIYPLYFSAELGLDIPDEIMTNPAIGSLLDLVADATLLINVCIDRYSLCVG